MNIRIANTDEEIQSCYSVMKELRENLIEKDFVEKIRSLQKNGYFLVFAEDSGKPVALAGFRIGESLAWKRYLYVDDLVTLPEYRSKGFGSALLKWLTDFASNEGCVTFHLDSGVQRKDAHRFYEREGLQISSYHFAKLIRRNKSN